MNLSIYDILSHLIPGFLVYVSILYSFNIDIDKLSMIPATVLAYVIGYIVNTLSSWSESILYWSWRGKPSDSLLDGKSIWKVAMFEGKKAKDLLLVDSGNKHTKNDELFEIAMRSINFESGTRLNDFNAAYSFSRSILISVILGLAFVISLHPNIYITLLGLTLIFIIWLRTKQKAYYFVREVFLEYLKLKSKSKTSQKKK